MKRAQAPDEVDAMDSHDFAVGEAVGDDAEGAPVVRVVEGRDDHDAVRDVEIRVARRDALPIENDRRRHGKRNYIKSCRSEPLAVLAKNRMVLIPWTFFLAKKNAFGRDEAREIVDVAVRVVADNPAAKPYHTLGPEHVGKDLLDPLAAEARIPRLRLRKQALFGAEEHPLSIHVDRAALHHDVASLDDDAILGHAKRPGDPPRDLVVLLVVRVLGPAVESPMGRDLLAGRIPYEDRAGIARPDAIGRDAEEVDLREIDADLL